MPKKPSKQGRGEPFSGGSKGPTGRITAADRAKAAARMKQKKAKK